MNTSYKVKGERFAVCCDLPIQDFKSNNYKYAMFKTLGDTKLHGRLFIISDTKIKHSNFIVSAAGEKDAHFEPLNLEDKMIEYSVPGDSLIKIKWE